MGEIFTPYTLREKSIEPKALSALQKVRGLEELLLGWVVQNRTLSLSPVSRSEQKGMQLNASASEVVTLDVQFSRSTKRVGAGVLNVDSLIPFLPTIMSVREAIDGAGSPSESWFDKRNAQLGIELDTEYDLNRCPPRSLSQMIFGYLLNHDAMCTVRSTGTAKNPQICLELVYLAPEPKQIEADLSSGPNEKQERVGWKEVCLVHRTALENFVPHVYWV